jgi:hypothetical protein
MNRRIGESVHLRLPAEIIERIREIAERERRTIAQVLRLVLEDGLAVRGKSGRPRKACPERSRREKKP